MNWSQLFTDFTEGKPDAIQAVFSIFGFIITLAGTIYVAITFHQQKKINKTQEKLNIISLEKDRRELMPYFTGRDIGNYSWDELEAGKTSYQLILKYNKALDVEIFPLDDDGKALNPIYAPSQVVLPEKEFTELTVRRASNLLPSTFEKQYLIYYTDEVGRPYMQKVGHDSEKVVLLYPQVVSDTFRDGLPKLRGR